MPRRCFDGIASYASSTAQQHNGFDLDRDLSRQATHPDSGARWSTGGLAQDLDEQVGTTVDDLRMLAEVGRSIHHAEHLQHSLHPIQRPGCGQIMRH